MGKLALLEVILYLLHLHEDDHKDFE